ncbi:biliverdin-producing heme oxygenase [Sphingomonas soli]|uniref:biliverdin-producing heme oxygenase n=1 Tax=Sphingomonas soli TaxID=266127 RepID=UPI00082AFE0E|nr:biliverdin-producing heme oxygenase [Sphingomonas soli]
MRAALRSATEQNHERVDAAFSQYDLSSREGYRRFLLRQAAAHLPVERALDDAAGDVIEDWAIRRRADAIRADLADLGCQDIAEAPFDGFTSQAGLLGGVYVLEGSRLGGQILRKQVSEALPTRFLAQGSSLAWRAFIAVLEAKLTSKEEIAEAIAGARAVFACFEAAARRDVESY